MCLFVESAVSLKDCFVRVWSTLSFELLFVLSGHIDIVWGVTICCDGETLISGSAGKVFSLRVVVSVVIMQQMEKYGCGV